VNIKFLIYALLAILIFNHQLAITIPNHTPEKQNITLNFRDIPVRDLLELLAEFKQKNLIISDTVKGNITIRLTNVSWEQALDNIIAMHGLGKNIQNSTLFVAPLNEIADYEKQNAVTQKLTSQLIEIHHAKASDLAMLLQNKSSNLLSERGSVLADTRTNSLWVRDTAKQIFEIRHFLNTIDIPAQQVSIAAKIVNVDENSVEQLGLKFGTNASNNKNTNQLFMDLPLTIENSGNFTIAIAKLGNNTLLDLELSALEQEGRARIISNPHLITTNHQPALIESGQEIPYQEQTSSGATSTVFKKAVLSLKVTPEITQSKQVLLNLAVNQDQVSTLTVNGIPAITTQQIQTQILVNNNETIVLGGIYEESNNHVTERIPFWGSIPIIGVLFTSKETQAERKELLIFVTPSIVSS